VITIHQRYRQTDRQREGRTDRRTDRQTTCDRNTVLCTKVHRAVKTAGSILSIIALNDTFLAKDVPLNGEKI